MVFVANPSQNEGSLHIARQTLISNRALLACATSVDLPSYIRSRLFHVKMWKPWPAATFVLAVAKLKPAAVEATVDEVEEAEAAALVLPEGEGAQSSIAGRPDEATGEVKGDEPSAQVAEDVDVEMATPIAVDENTNQEEQPSVTEGSAGKQGVAESADPSNDGKKKKKKKKGKKKQTDPGLQPLGDKVSSPTFIAHCSGVSCFVQAIADVAEAILGAAYISGGREGGLRAAKAMALPVADINTWSDFGTKVVITFNSDMNDALPGAIEGVEAIIGHKFRQTHLLAQVLVGYPKYWKAW